MTLDDLIKRLEEIKAEHGGGLSIRIDVDGRDCEIYNLERFAVVLPLPSDAPPWNKELLLQVGY